MAMVDVCQCHIAAYTGGLNAQVRWLGWMVGRCLHQAAADPPTKLTELGIESACGLLYGLHNHCHLLLLSRKADTFVRRTR